MTNMTEILNDLLEQSEHHDETHGKLLPGVQLAFRSGGQFGGVVRRHPAADGYFIAGGPVMLQQPPEHLQQQGMRPNTPVLMEQIFHGDDVERIVTITKIDQPLIQGVA